jgi:predicted dehydrogenase
MKEAVIIGCGSMGERHSRYLSSQGIKLKAFADPRWVKSDKPYVYSDPIKCIRENAQDSLVVIASPNHVHAEQAIEAVYSGARALYIEKPVAVNDIDAYHLLEVADTHKVRVVVGYNFRFHPGIHNLINNVIQPNFWLSAVGIDDHTTWPTYKNLGEKSHIFNETGGMLWTSGSHAIDIAMFLHGEVGEILTGEDANGTAVIQRLHHIGGGVSVLYNKWEEGHPQASSLTYTSPADAIVVDLLVKQPVSMHNQLMFHALEYFNKNILHPHLPTLSDAIHGVNVILASEESMKLQKPVLV